MIAADILELPRHQKLELMEALWEDLATQPQNVEVPEWHRELLDERLAAVEEGKDQFIPWEEAKREIERRIR